MENKNHFEDAFEAADMNTADREIVLAPDPADRASGETVLKADMYSNDAVADETEASFEVAEAPKQVMRVNEIPELRGENKKVFRMNDGTEQAVFYAEPIHVFNEETQCFETADTVLTEKDRAFVS